jgi:hypothetical protein
MRGWKKFRITGLLLILFLSAAFMFFLFTRNRKVQFPDGSTLEWLGLTQGTNLFVEGNLLEKLFGRLSRNRRK